jgi:ribonuclease Z
MDLTVLGAGTALPVPGRSPAGYLLRVGGEPLLFDLGPGTLARLAAAGVSYREIRRVFVSHLHSDHVLDLVTLLQASNATPRWTRREPLELFGCRGLEAFVARMMETFDGAAPEGFEVRVTELDAGDRADRPYPGQPRVPGGGGGAGGRVLGGRRRDAGADAARARRVGVRL